MKKIAERKKSNIQKNKKIAVVGLGYVGLPLALLADLRGYQVVGIDRDKSKAEKINSRIMPFEDRKIARLLRASKIEATTDWNVISDVSTVIICVPTPVDHKHQPDLNPVKDACVNIGKYLKVGQMIILESTVNPGICEDVVLPLLEETSGLRAGKDFYILHCPERINPGDTKWHVENIPRVIGSLEQKGLKKGLAFYKSIIGAEIRPMKSLKEAEAVKIVENSFRDINIAFVNELAQSFSHLGIDVVNVIDGAATKPFSFLAHYPGCGVGGHCIPVDPYYLIEYAKKNGFKHHFLTLARKINNNMPKFTADLALEMMADANITVSGSKIAVLGLAYKANIGDSRESPSFEIVRYLKTKGVNVVTFDPHVKHLSTAKSLNEATHDAKAVIVATNHKAFINLSPSFFLKHNVPIIIDGKNCLTEDSFVHSGLIYQGIGKRHIYHNN